MSFNAKQVTRRTFVGGAGLAIAAGLVACGGKSTTKGGTSGTSSEDRSDNIYWLNFKPEIDEAIQLEEAVAYDNILRDFSWTQEELGKRLGKSRSYISNILRLLKLETEYLEALKEGQITSSQARTLLAMESKERKKFYKKLCNKETNVREMEKAVKQKTINLYQKQIEEELSTWVRE